MKATLALFAVGLFAQSALGEKPITHRFASGTIMVETKDRRIINYGRPVTLKQQVIRASDRHRSMPTVRNKTSKNVVRTVDVFKDGRWWRTNQFAKGTREKLLLGGQP